MQEHIRQLAAVMFTDMVGYTSLMQEDEQKTKLKRDRHKKILEKLVIDHHGLLLQYYGDGSLSVFGSAIEAVECAVKIQNKMHAEPKIPLRIGLHIGDIAYADDGVYGDAVNIASRIQSLAASGGVYISDKVYDEIKNHPEFPTRSLGEIKLKNVKHPMRVYALVNTGLSVLPIENIKSPATGTSQSIAVLPFVNLSNDPDNEYFSDGMTEEIINALTKISGLHVTSRTSSFVYKDKALDIRQVGRELNVYHVLEGSVRKSGEKVRITAQLINTNDGYHIWSENFDREMEDIFEIQDDISTKIATKLCDNITCGDFTEPLVNKSTTNLQAYNLYLKGLFYWNMWTAKSAKKALELYKRAIKNDPNFALAFSAISGCYVFLAAIGYIPVKSAYTNAKKYALKSVELDANLSESQLSLAMVKFFFDWDWYEAESYFKKAIRINPGSAVVHHDYSLFLTAMGRFEENIHEAQIAFKLDPLSLVNSNGLGNAYFYAGRFNDAIQQLENTLELDPDFAIALSNLGWVYLEKENFEKAIQLFRKAQKQTNNGIKQIAPLAYAFAMAGKIAETKKLLKQLNARAPLEKELELSLDYAMIYMGLGDFDRVFHHLERAYENHYSELVFLRLPHWKKIHDNPRYKDLIGRIGLE